MFVTESYKNNLVFSTGVVNTVIVLKSRGGVYKWLILYVVIIIIVYIVC